MRMTPFAGTGRG